MKFSLKSANLLKRTTALCLNMLLICANALPQSSNNEYIFRAQTEIVLVNITAKDKDGNLVRDLKREDFTLLEDNKPQQILSFDLENTDLIPTSATSEAPLLASAPATPPYGSTPNVAFKDRRLIVLFFDLTSMQPEDIERAAAAAQNYVAKQMKPADLVSVLSLGNSLSVNLDFSADRAALKKALDALNTGGGQGFEEGTTGTTEGTADTGQSFTVDDTEYNIFNTDRRLQALRSVADKLSEIQQKKSLIYFSSGMDRTGVENQSELRATTNAAVRANLSIYTMDLRGLQALVPGGEAQNASLRGTSPYSGQSTLSQYNSNFSTQETLTTLAADTGGRAFLDTNDFSRVFTGVQQDTASYYILGYHSSNSMRDGKFRKITVRVNRAGIKLVARRGYYAPADFQHSTKDDREKQLDEELASELPSTDLPVYLSAAYFRLAENRFYVPVSVVVPGSQIPFTHSRNKDEDRATLDVLGVILDPQQRPVSQVRETVKLSVDSAQTVQRKNVQYNSSFTLPSGKYHIKFVVRENETGRMGSFETDFNVPELKNIPLKMSSLILASQVQPGKKNNANPLSRDGSEIVPSVTHVFTSNQHLYLYYEVYDPAHAGSSQATKAPGDIRLLSNVSFFHGRTKAYETPILETDRINAPDRHAVVFRLDIPLTELKPGFYTCQINVIDDANGQFRFPRTSLLVRP